MGTYLLPGRHCRAPFVKVTLVEAGPNILGTFDAALVKYYSRSLEKRGIDVRLSTAVTSVEDEVRMSGLDE